jgi:DNA-binding response OmpR family regulator
MTKRAIYLTHRERPDAALEKGLEEAGCQVQFATTFAEALQLLRGTEPALTNRGVRSPSTSYARSDLASRATLLVATIRSGAIPLLTLLREQGIEIPPSLILDEDGNDVHTIIKALQLGVREYVLASDPEVQRRLSARLLAERASTRNGFEPQTHTERATASPSSAPGEFEWDPIGRVIHIGENYLRLSSVEGHIFDLLLASRSRTVPVAELVHNVLMRTNVEVTIGARRLRPHVMRLRRKLERYPTLGMRIVNMRGTGYMLI